MAPTVSQKPTPAQVQIPDVRKTMAKATFAYGRIPNEEWLRAIGGAVQRAISMVGWSNQEAAHRIGVDDSELGKWINATDNRRPQFDKLFAVEELRQPLVLALARLAHAEISMRIDFPKSA